MTILSKDTLTLLRDGNFRKTVEEVLKKEAGQPSSATVTVPNADSAPSNEAPESRLVTVRRLSV